MVRNAIDIYTFEGKTVEIKPTGKRLTLNKKLRAWVDKQWAGKGGWDNAWIPSLESIESCGTNVVIRSGVVSFSQTYGILQALENGLEFAPTSGGLNNLSIGVFPITSDGFLAIARRSGNVRASGIWNVPGGYMSSRFIAKDEGREPSELDYAFDARVFSVPYQLDVRVKRQEFFGLTADDFVLDSTPRTMAFGFKHSLEPELGVVARFKLTRKEFGQHAVLGGKHEHSDITYVALEDIETLIKNQGDLIDADPRKYNTSDPRRIILLEDNIGELLGGVYEQITQRGLGDSTVEDLRRSGWRISINRMDGKSGYKFQTVV